jgi:protocatechuate 3,4-dioxygenase beta subunit
MAKPNFRRRKIITAGLAIFATPVAGFAQLCRVTPRDALGPFYVKGAPAQAELCASGSGGGQKLTVSGHVLGTPDCAPLAGALVEVWQADSRGDYTQVGAKQGDAGCLLRASLTTDAGGRYRFQTIVPGEYPGRPRHIHYRVSANGHATLVTQLYFAPERGIPEGLVVKMAQKAGAVAASFDVTLIKA